MRQTEPMTASSRPSSYHDVVDEPLLRITERDRRASRARAVLFQLLRDHGAAIEPFKALSRFTLFAALRRSEEAQDQEELDHVASLLP